MQEKIKEFLNKLNKLGIPIPLIRDNKTGVGSVSLTMMVISFNVVLLGLIGKWSKYLDIDMTSSLYWFGVCASLYFSRKITTDGKSISVEDSSKTETKE